MIKGLSGKCEENVKGTINFGDLTIMDAYESNNPVAA